MQCSCCRLQLCVYVIMALFMNLWCWMVWNIFLESFCCASKHVPFVFIALRWHLVGLIGFWVLPSWVLIAFKWHGLPLVWVKLNKYWWFRSSFCCGCYSSIIAYDVISYHNMLCSMLLYCTVIFFGMLYADITFYCIMFTHFHTTNTYYGNTYGVPWMSNHRMPSPSLT